MGNTWRTVFFAYGATGGSNVIVLNSCPLFVFNVILNSCHVLIDREADNTDFITPVFSGFKHVLIVRHRGLTWRAPGGPEIKEHHLALFVFNSTWAFCSLSINVNLIDASHWFNFAANSFSSWELNFSVSNTTKSLLKSIFDGCNGILHVGVGFSFNYYTAFFLLHVLVEHVDYGTAYCWIL